MTGRGPPRGGRGSGGRLDSAPRGAFRNDARGQGRGRGGYGAPEEVKLFTPVEGLSGPDKNVTQLEDNLVKNANRSRHALLSTKDEVRLPRRPGYGTTGQKVILRTNYFNLQLAANDLQLFRYDVTVDPSEVAARKRQRAFQLLLEEVPFLRSAAPGIATDYRSTIITTKKLQYGDPPRDLVQESVVISYYETEEVQAVQGASTFRFRITSTNTLSIQQLLDYLRSDNPQTTYPDKEAILQALNIAMTRKPSNAPGISSLTGNRFFPSHTFLGNLGGGLVALQGYFSSVRTGTGRLLLNLNSITAASYLPGPLITLMSAFKSACRGDLLPELQQFLKGLRIETTHLKTKKGVLKKRVINSLADTPSAGLGADASQVSFSWDTGNGNVLTTTVEEYFQRKYNIKLHSPKVPLMNVGNSNHPNYVPAELCTVLPGQVARKKLTSDQTSEMIRVAARKPADNARLIVAEGASTMGLGPIYTDGPTIFGLRIKPEMITVHGRVLEAPRLLYRASDMFPNNGAWNMKDVKFFVGAHISNWSYLEIKWRERSRTMNPPLQLLMQDFRDEMRKCGLIVDEPRPVNGFSVLELDPAISSQHHTKIDGAFKEIRRTGARMVFISLPERNAPLYAKLKYYADVKYGVHSVCSVASKLTKPSGRSQYLANIALKFNLKRGGLNQQIPADKMGLLADGKTMVMGIDVTHPSPGSQENAPSVASVVASIDKRCGQWPGSVRAQESRKEMVSNLDTMIVERLRLWQKHNKVLPQNILVYRDGVSEGQYRTVLEVESLCFDTAINQLYAKAVARPKVSIVVVGKRHHTRFYPTHRDNADQKNGNPRNGTVVDRGVTSERNWDFFLQAHYGLQGTAKPAHYIVLQDQIGLGAGGLEQLTHNLCYLFGRATRAVSVCPPAFYADLLCERSRCYLYDTFNQTTAARTGPRNTPTGNTHIAPNQTRWLDGVHADLQESMFYI